MEFPKSPQLCPTPSLSSLHFSSHTATIHLKEMPWGLVMAPFPSVLCSGCSEFSRLYTALLFTINTPLQENGTASKYHLDQDRPWPMGPRAGPDPALSGSVTYPAVLPTWYPKESLPCWAPMRSFPSLWQHLGRKRSDPHKTHLQACGFIHPQKHQAPKPLCWVHLV